MSKKSCFAHLLRKTSCWCRILLAKGASLLPLIVCRDYSSSRQTVCSGRCNRWIHQQDPRRGHLFYHPSEPVDPWLAGMRERLSGAHLRRWRELALTDKRRFIIGVAGAGVLGLLDRDEGYWIYVSKKTSRPLRNSPNYDKVCNR